MYMPNTKTRRQAPNATYIPLEYRLRLLPNAKKSTQKERNVHGQRKKLASPNARDTNMLVFLALGDAEVLSFVLGDAKVPYAGIALSTRQIANGEFKLKLANQILVKIAKTKLSGD